MKLFESLVRPVLSYSSEVWRMSMPNTSNVCHPENVLDPLYDINPPEQIFTRFCKTMLGVHSKAVNRAVRAELGVYPLYIHTILQTVTYWLHLMQLPPRQSGVQCIY
jgi:hypothetical protein